jgi:HK97 gp10 family phage protein
MPNDFEIKITGLDELTAHLSDLPAELYQAIGQILDDGTQAIAAEAKQRAPGNTGFLQNQIGSEYMGPLSYTVFSGASYSAFVEFGTRAKVVIPAGLEEFAAQFKGDFTSGTYSEGSGSELSAKEAIFAWCQQKGIEKELWYAIYVSIMINGIQPQPFFFPAVNRILPIIQDQIIKAENIDLDIIFKASTQASKQPLDLVAAQILNLICPSVTASGLAPQPGMQFLNVKLQSDRYLSLALNASNTVERRILTFKLYVAQL